MADRVVRVTLSAQVSNYLQGMEQARKATDKVGGGADDAQAKLAEMRDAFQQIGRTSVAVGAVLAAGIGVAVARFAEFDQAMSNVDAATHESAENMDLLRQAAIDAGASTVFSATEAAGAIEELAKAGVSTADILAGGLTASLDLAAAGGLGVADAAGIAATALKVFGLQGSDMSHVADLLAAGAGKAMGDVQDLSQALAQGGQVAAATGLSIEETTAALSAFAAQGLLGSDAGTSFKTMLQRLTPQSAEAKAKMDELGISAYDAQGRFIGLEQFAGKLRAGMQALTPEARNAAMATMFGSDAVRAATVLYAEGADGIREWTTAVNDQGYAAETARKRLDNLKGDLEALGGALDSALIQTGSHANDTLRAMVQALTGLVDLYNDLPGPVQGATLAVGGAVAAIALTGGTALLAVPKIAEFKKAMEVTGMTMRGLSLTAGGASLALGGLFAIVGALATAHAEARAKAEAYAQALEAGSDAARDMVAQNLTAEKSWLWLSRGSTADAAEKFGISLTTLADAAQGSNTALDELADIIRAGSGEQEAAQRVADEYGMTLGDVSAASSLVAESVLGEAKSLEQAKRINEQKNKITADGADTTRDAADAYMEAADNADQLNQRLSDLIDTIFKQNNANLDARETQRQWVQALQDFDAALTVNGTTLDLNTDAGRQNEANLDRIAQRAMAVAQATTDAGGSYEDFRASLENSRQALLDRINDLGISGTAASDLADQILRIPDQTEWELITKTDAARATIDQFIRTYDGREIALQLTTNQVVVNDRVYGGLRDGRARGGIIPGAPSNVDNRIYALATGEFVTRASQVAIPENRRALEYMNAGGVIRGFADGGFVQPRYAPSPVYVTAPTVSRGPAVPPVSIGPVYGADAQAIAREIVSEFEWSLAISGVNWKAGD